MILLGDEAVCRLPASRVVELMTEIVALHECGGLDAPPRVEALLGDGRMVFTVGGTAEHVGFRAYGVDGSVDGLDQVVLVFARDTGHLLGGVVGAELGRQRTGALGAIASQLLSRHDASSLGVIGTGPQAWAHVWALSSVRRLEHVTVFSRDAERRNSFAERCRRELGLVTEAVDGTAEAVVGRDLVTLATTSGTPVLKADWVSPGCHITSLGPKTVEHHEFPAELAARCAIIATDSLRQFSASARPSVLSLLPGQLDRIRSLGQLLATGVDRGPEDITMFCSVGLSGTEVLLATEVLARWGDADSLPSVTPRC